MVDKKKAFYSILLLGSSIYFGLRGVFIILIITATVLAMCGKYPFSDKDNKVGQISNNQRPFGSNIKTISDIPKSTPS